MKYLALVLACLVLLLGPAPLRAQNSDYPFQTQTFAQDMTVTQVDPDRDRVQVGGDDGKTYTLDTYRATIVLLTTKHPGQTGDLVEGMRIHVTGTLVSGSIVEADRVAVLPFHPPSAAPPDSGAPVYAAPGGGTAQDNGGGVTLRGTVEAVDQKRGQFVVRVEDHTRTVRLTYDTDTTALPPSADRVPVHPGDRVTVAGVFDTDGSVVADTVSLSRDLRAIGPAHRPGLTGAVVSTSDRLRSRDIKVRDSSGRDVTVHVPRSASITRDGKPISVHDLGRQDVVRVDGVPDGDALRASAIAVVGDVRDENPPPISP